MNDSLKLITFRYHLRFNGEMKFEKLEGVCKCDYLFTKFEIQWVLKILLNLINLWSPIIRNGKLPRTRTFQDSNEQPNIVGCHRYLRGKC
jgi:hypothetical protein